MVVRASSIFIGGANEGEGSHPTLMYIHGGGWVSGRKEDGLMYTLPWLEMGWNVVNVEYRLGGVAAAPEALGGLSVCICDGLLPHAAQYRIDPARLVGDGRFIGRAPRTHDRDGTRKRGAGSRPPCNLVRRIAPIPKVAGIVNWYGITDVSDLLQGPNTRGYAVEWVAKAANREEMARRVSPVTWARSDSPPIITIHGDSDPTVPYSQAIKLRDALEAVHARNELITIPGGKHGGFSPDERIRAYIAIRRFLSRYGLPTAIESDKQSHP